MSVLVLNEAQVKPAVVSDMKSFMAEILPDTRSGEPVDDLDPELGCRASGVLDLLGGPSPHPLMIPVAPNPRGNDALVSVIDRIIAHALAHQVGADGEAAKPMLVEDIPAALDVGIVGQGLVHFKVVPPTGQLEAIVAKALGLLCHSFEGKVRPLSGEKRHWSGHLHSSCSIIRRCQ